MDLPYLSLARGVSTRLQHLRHWSRFGWRWAVCGKLFNLRFHGRKNGEKNLEEHIAWWKRIDVAVSFGFIVSVISIQLFCNIGYPHLDRWHTVRFVVPQVVEWLGSLSIRQEWVQNPSGLRWIFNTETGSLLMWYFSGKRSTTTATYKNHENPSSK